MGKSVIALLLVTAALTVGCDRDTAQAVNTRVKAAGEVALEQVDKMLGEYRVRRIDLEGRIEKFEKAVDEFKQNTRTQGAGRDREQQGIEALKGQARAGQGTPEGTGGLHRRRQTGHARRPSAFG